MCRDEESLYRVFSFFLDFILELWFLPKSPPPPPQAQLLISIQLNSNQRLGSPGVPNPPAAPQAKQVCDLMEIKAFCVLTGRNPNRELDGPISRPCGGLPWLGLGRWPGLGGPGDCSSSFRTCLRPEPEPSDAGADTRSSAAPARSLISDGEITESSDKEQRGLGGLG